jgi:S-disulfanyl-L-cysteine oxidoreductase SoxD
MPMFKLGILLPAAALCLMSSVCEAQHPNLGRPLSPEEISKLDLTVAPDGNGLPAGSGSVSAGAKVYADKCQSCHGANGQGGPQDQLTGGVGTIASDKPVKTPVSYWPSATTIFDYVRRAMPLQSPQSLTNDEVYAVTAYILSIDKVVPEDAVLDAKSLPQVKMPNRDGFVRWWPVPKR